MPRDDLPLCKCGWFERAANDPKCPIEFDPEVNEYHLVSNGGSWCFYHCPICAGRAPASHRADLFARIPREEEVRLHLLIKDLRTEDDVLRQLGQPSARMEPGAGTIHPGKSGNPDQRYTYTTLRYDQHSTIADINVRINQDGTVSISLSGKYIGKPS
jgi:hypothetical protein